ncbi:MAG: methylated-DNA--[protein]-cysteine S-methyltransferase [Candidatus Competibacteraceae bacterium]|jgi:methylated-DNA-protein-cysteine methyltransferase-like protein|nr:methylated-DNA--[protein]-cysteine S-methyltransferase [Candidatus Competibacteraceae bacterium]
MCDRRVNERFQRIWQTVATIPYGRVATYGRIAEWAGFPRQARAVGYALHNLPAQSSIPWHRVINANGMISFPLGSEPHRRQHDLLLDEGILFDGQRIDLKRFGWQPTLDEAVWGGR